MWSKYFVMQSRDAVLVNGLALTFSRRNSLGQACMCIWNRRYKGFTLNVAAVPYQILPSEPHHTSAKLTLGAATMCNLAYSGSAHYNPSGSPAYTSGWRSEWTCRHVPHWLRERQAQIPYYLYEVLLWMPGYFILRGPKVNRTIYYF